MFCCFFVLSSYHIPPLLCIVILSYFPAKHKRPADSRALGIMREIEPLLGVLDCSLCCHRYIAPIISYPHAHIQVRPLVDSPAGRKAVDILLCIVDRQRKGADFDAVIRVKFAICIVSGPQIPTELIL